MGILDPVFGALSTVVETVERLTQAALNPQIENEQASETVGTTLEDVEPVSEVGAVLVDIVEEAILSDVQDAGQLTEQNVEQVADQTEGASMSALAGLYLAAIGVESGSLGQLEGQTELVTQAILGLNVDEVTGMELDARASEGIMPALEAKANRDHRSKYANLQDHIEQDLRNKDSDTGYIDDVAMHGIRPDQVALLEEVAINDMEFEELIETPAELGLVVSDEVLQAELDRAGYAEDTKEFLQQVNDRIPRSTRTYQELIETEGLVQQLDRLIEEEELTPAEAADLFPNNTETSISALTSRWDNLQSLPQQAPTRSLIEGSFAGGYTDLETFRSRMERLEYNTSDYEGVLQKQVREELDGDLQESLALGTLSEREYADLAEFAGIDDGAIELLLQGQSFSDITTRRLKQDATPSERSVRTVVGIGESRGSALSGAGIETVADLAQADAGTVADAAQVSEETAQGFIDSASARVQ